MVIFLMELIRSLLRDAPYRVKVHETAHQRNHQALGHAPPGTVEGYRKPHIFGQRDCPFLWCIICQPALGTV